MPEDIWSLYQSRLDSHGVTMRDAVKKREIRFLNSKLSRSLSYYTASIDGVDKTVAIINSDNLNEKKIISMPGDTISCGSMVYWEDNYWIVTEKDAADELYTKCNMMQCNHLLKWISKDADGNPVIHEQWCIIDDGTKYMTGDYEDRDFIVTRGDSRISMVISRNSDTVKFGRESRFLIDDPDSEQKLAYTLSKPMKVGRYYNGEGIYVFVLKETASTDFDSMELGIADYYHYFDKPGNNQDDDTQTEGQKRWL